MCDLKTLSNLVDLPGLPCALGYRGSIAYGLNTLNTKDVDLFYIYTLNKSHYLGITQGVESNQFIEGKFDVATFELRKWCKLINKQSPTILEQLFLDRDDWIFNTLGPIYRERHKFLSKRIYNPFVKYAISLPDDAKSKSHSARLLTMCYEALTTGELNVYRREDYQFFLDIKYGDLDPQSYIVNLLSKCEDALKTTRLPDEPDTELLNRLCVEVVEDAIISSIIRETK